MIKETTAEAAEALDNAAQALREAEQARRDYDAWMAAWRALRGHRGPYDPDTGCPLAQLEAAE